MSQMFLAFALLTLLSCQTLLAATVRPYKFGFTIEEQQHRAESRDENGIVMGEFGFITADGIYHVTVYATDENGKFRIISMKNFPYAGPKAPKSPPPTPSTQRTPTPVTKHNFHTAACSGCFLGNSLPDPKRTANVQGDRSTKNEIRPLSQPLSPAAAAVPGEQFTGHTHTQTHTQQTHTQSGIVGQTTFENVDALQEASIQLAILAQHPDATGSQVTLGAAPVPPAAPAAPAITTTTPLPPVVVNAQTVALSHAIAKVQGMLVTSRPSPSASAPQAQHLLPESVFSSALHQVQKLARVPPAATIPRDLNSFTFGPQPGNSQQQQHQREQQQQQQQKQQQQQQQQRQQQLQQQLKQQQQQQQQLTNSAREAQRINENVLKSMQQLVLPIAHKTVEHLTSIPPAKTDAKDLNSFAFGQLPAKGQQVSLAKVENGNTLEPLVIVEQLTRIPPAKTDAKDLNSFAYGQLPAKGQQLPLDKVENENTLEPLVTVKHLTRIPLAKDLNSFAYGQLPLKGQQVPLAKVEKGNTLEPLVTVEHLPRITPAATDVNNVKNFAYGVLSTKSPQLISANAVPDLIKAQGLSGVNTFQPLTLAGIVNQQSTPSSANRIQFAPISDSLINTQKTTTPAQLTHTVAHTQPLSVKSVQQPIKAIGNAAVRPAVTTTQQQSQPTGFKRPLVGAQPEQRPQPVSSSAANLKPSLGAAQLQPGTGSSASSQPNLGATQTQQRSQPSGGSLASFTPAVAVQPAVTGTNPIQAPNSGSVTSTQSNPATKFTTNSGAVGSADLTGDLYKFKYLLDYNGHEETGSRNGDKVGNYFAIGDDAVKRVVEYIANEFGFQPHISWRKLEGNEAALPADNSLKHYEFKWFNKDSE